MEKFYHRYKSSDLKLQQAVAVLPWSHNLLLLSKGVNDEAVVFYSHEVVSKGWPYVLKKDNQEFKPIEFDRFRLKAWFFFSKMVA